MTTKVYIQSDEDQAAMFVLVKSAVAAEIARIEMAIQLSLKRLKPFEDKYSVTSEYFITEMSAEDLDGGDDEYVHWAGEYRLRQKLKKKLSRLQNIKYEN